MKKVFLTLTFALFATVSFAQGFSAYVADPSSTPTNIRNSPGGKVVATLHDDDMITLDRCVNGWFHITYNEYDNGGEGGKICKTTSELWIHHSVITSTWNGDGETTAVTLYSKPSRKSPVARKCPEGENHAIIDILDYKDGWVKVKVKTGHTGWVESSELCGNSLTNCC